MPVISHDSAELSPKGPTDCLSMWPAVVPILLLLLVAAPIVALDVIEIVQRSYEEQPYETLLLLRHSSQLQCSQMEQVAAAVSQPVLRLNSEANFYLRDSQSTKMLALICLTGDRRSNEELWQTLASNLCNMRHVRLLLLLQQETAKHLDQLFQELANVTGRLGFPHVVLLLSTGSAYQLQPYTPEHWLLLQPNNSKQPIFARQYNYHGRTAKMLLDQVSPRSLAYREPRTGELRVTGFLAKTIHEFALKHNISLRWHGKVTAGARMSIIVLRNMTLNGTLNLAGTLCGYELASRAGYFTYPFDVSDWFVIVPCAQEIATAEVYLMVWSTNMLVVLLASYCVFTLLDTCFGWLLMDQGVSWTNLVFNERMISGIIGQPCKLHAQSMSSSRLAHAQLFLLGLIVATLFAAHLKTLLTKRPIERMVTNFEQLHDSHLNIYFTEAEQFYVNLMTKEYNLNIIKSKIKFIETSEFYRRRRSFNKSAFSIISTDWQFIQRQQSVFQRPAFCLRTDLIFRYMILSALPLPANSIYAEPLERHLQRVHETGLVLYWKAQSLRDFIALGEIKMKDPNPYVPFHEFKVGDLFWVWLGWASVLAMACVIFLCELIVHRLTKRA